MDAQKNMSTLAGLDHATIICADLAQSITFYEEVIGLRVGWRPAFDFPGAWLYMDDRPLVHLVGGRALTPGPTGAVEHVAFAAKGLAGWCDRLLRLDVAYTQADEVPDLNQTQVFLQDPNGVKIELNFSAERDPH